MRLPRCLVALLAPVVVACGLGTSTSLGEGGDGGGGGGGGDAGHDAGCSRAVPHLTCYSCGSTTVSPECVDGAWTCPPPPPCVPQTCDGPMPACTGCKGEPVSGQCLDGSWQCPSFSCPIELDAGCGTPPPGVCKQPSPCPDVPVVPQCTNGVWSCLLPECKDASPPDAAPPAFACVNVACDPESSYCQLTTGGPVVLDGGSLAAQCIPLPKTCSAGQATCACVQSVQGIGCSCVEQHGDVTVTCELP